MGSPLNEPGRDSDERRHKVSLTRPFYLQTTEVTQGQWLQVMGDNPSQNQEDQRYPVDVVSWREVERFIAKLNLRQGKLIQGIHQEVLSSFMAHKFPGNIRELENIIEHAFVLCTEGVITSQHLPGFLFPAGDNHDNNLSIFRATVCQYPFRIVNITVYSIPYENT